LENSEVIIFRGEYMAFGKKNSNKKTPSARTNNSSYLGTLRSEFDEPETIPTGFTQLQNNIAIICKAFLEGKVNERQAAELLVIQRCSDLNGGEWTVGATSGSWYRRQGIDTPWMEVPSPSQAVGNPLPGAWQRDIIFPGSAEYDNSKGLGILDATDIISDSFGNENQKSNPKSNVDLSDKSLEAAMEVGPRGEKIANLETMPVNEVLESTGPVGGVFSGIEDFFVPPKETK